MHKKSEEIKFQLSFSTFIIINLDNKFQLNNYVNNTNSINSEVQNILPQKNKISKVFEIQIRRVR